MYLVSFGKENCSKLFISDSFRVHLEKKYICVYLYMCMYHRHTHTHIQIRSIYFLFPFVTAFPHNPDICTFRRLVRKLGSWIHACSRSNYGLMPISSKEYWGFRMEIKYFNAKQKVRAGQTWMYTKVSGKCFKIWSPEHLQVVSLNKPEMRMKEMCAFRWP